MASLPCENCDSSDAVESYDDGDFCFSCHKKINSKRLSLESDLKKQKNPKPVKLVAITEHWINWLKNRGINDKTISYFNLQYDDLSKSIVYTIKVASEIRGYQLRDENKKIKTVRYAKEDEAFLFECSANDTSVVVVVEDPISAMRIWQDANINAVALMGTNLTIINKLYLITKYNKIIVWMDGDIAGYKAAQQIDRDCRVYCETKGMFTRYDPKDYPPTEIKRLLNVVLRDTNDE